MSILRAQSIFLKWQKSIKFFNLYLDLLRLFTDKTLSRRFPKTKQISFRFRHTELVNYQQKYSAAPIANFIKFPLLFLDFFVFLDQGKGPSWFYQNLWRWLKPERRFPSMDQENLPEIIPTLTIL